MNRNPRACRQHPLCDFDTQEQECADITDIEGYKEVNHVPTYPIPLSRTSRGRIRVPGIQRNNPIVSYRPCEDFDAHTCDGIIHSGKSCLWDYSDRKCKS